jgi:Cu/Ag efflux protein CusF
MKSPRLASLLLLAVAPIAIFAAETKTAEKSAPAARHPLRGVITSVVADKSAFMVKHEDIPGVMRAMTMMFHVDAATLKTFKVGDAITGLMSRQSTGWVLEDVKPAAPKSAK